MRVSEAFPIADNRSVKLSYHAGEEVALKEIQPPISRYFQVPGDYTLYDLHCVLQVVMGWQVWGAEQKCGARRSKSAAPIP